MRPITISQGILLLATVSSTATIDREEVVRQFNPRRNATSEESPMQVGNGNFAFGADITGLQSVLPWNILSTWCWHNSSLPQTPGQTSPADYTGVQWWTHDRLVTYAQPNPEEDEISQWLIRNPHRVNMGRIGLLFDGSGITEADLADTSQYLDMWNGILHSNFSIEGAAVSVQTVVDPRSDTVAVQLQSELVGQGRLSVFFDYPYMTGENKFETFVGLWNATSNHATSLHTFRQRAEIKHDLDATTYYTTIVWEEPAAISRISNSSHKYILEPADSNVFTFTATYTPNPLRVSNSSSTFSAVADSSTTWWNDYWTAGAFVDLTAVENPPESLALQGRILLSQYLLAVNGASANPPQESGLTNNGWYGKFHLEMYLWHGVHWAVWNRWKCLRRSLDTLYQRFLPTSFERAADQGYTGARWGKMSDPAGRSAPGEINSLLIWQQPHPLYFAELEYQASLDGTLEEEPNEILDKWDDILTATADFMSSYAFFNSSTDVYDLGPPMYPVSENTPPNSTMNAIFESAYWRFGLSIASAWKSRQDKPIPSEWTTVLNNLAPLPVQDGTYVVCEGVQDPWSTDSLTEDHPGAVGIYGLLPPSDDIPLDMAILDATLAAIDSTWNFTASFGWDFPMLAMNAARMGRPQEAVDWLLDPGFQFDDVGMPIGGARVPTPYFPASAGLLWAVGMLAGGWYSDEGSTLEDRWPSGWQVHVEDFGKSL
ncbi:Six-hairpin glycosidase-like protein [Lineolata rhizophorae]|uniref:Six-hairpin glycosidase-like protein n=1 Tax=Lineolata rhizophorae TaxID=578093 RepID=A0A6A6NWF3_9PEZI|nr:Six-hairpin glycosidase-like protein [Lineolata rhizophorae]